MRNDLARNGWKRAVVESIARQDVPTTHCHFLIKFLADTRQLLFFAHLIKVSEVRSIPPWIQIYYLLSVIMEINGNHSHIQGGEKLMALVVFDVESGRREERIEETKPNKLCTRSLRNVM